VVIVGNHIWDHDSDCRVGKPAKSRNDDWQHESGVGTHPINLMTSFAYSNVLQSPPVIPGVQRAVKAPASRIAIKTRGRILLINSGEIFSVKAEGNYVSLQRDSTSYLLRESISQMAEKLEPFGFIRIHRSVLVNISFVEEIRPHGTGEYLVRMTNGREFTVTRTYKENLKSLAEFWIGTGTFFQD
jgi:DNA-binding LytR/AlgR family response regulator